MSPARTCSTKESPILSAQNATLGAPGATKNPVVFARRGESIDLGAVRECVWRFDSAPGPTRPRCRMGGWIVVWEVQLVLAIYLLRQLLVEVHTCSTCLGNGSPPPKIPNGGIHSAGTFPKTPMIPSTVFFTNVSSRVSSCILPLTS